MKHLLLTGATGFLGSHLLDSLLAHGYKVTILKRSSSDIWRISHLMKDVNAYNVDCNGIERAFKSEVIDAVIHTASCYGRKGQSAHEVVEANLIFSLRLLDVAISYNVDLFVNSDTFFNSSSSLSKYLSAYTLSKKQFSEWLKLRSRYIDVVNLKLQHMYGPNDDDSKFIPWLVSQLSQGVERIPLTKGMQRRDFIYIDDVVSAYLISLKRIEQMPAYSEYDVGTGVPTRVRDFVIELYDAYKRIDPNMKAELGFGDILMHEGELMDVDVDISDLKKLGWKPNTTLADGISNLF